MLTVIKFEDYCNTCSKCPPLGCMHAANHCAIECCHSMCPSSFLMPTVASSVALTNWCLASLICHRDTLSTSCIPTERNITSLNQETDGAKPPVHFFLSIFLYNLCSKILLPLCWNVEVLHHVVVPFIFMLQEAHSLNATVINFPENACNMELLSASR
jgi:hypothetical protein